MAKTPWAPSLPRCLAPRMVRSPNRERHHDVIDVAEITTGGVMVVLASVPAR